MCHNRMSAAGTFVRPAAELIDRTAFYVMARALFVAAAPAQRVEPRIPQNYTTVE